MPSLPGLPQSQFVASAHRTSLQPQKDHYCESDMLDLRAFHLDVNDSRSRLKSRHVYMLPSKARSELSGPSQDSPGQGK